jgi:hypothetical protein
MKPERWVGPEDTKARHARVVLIHPAPEPGAGAAYMDDLDGLPETWKFASWEAVDPDRKKPPPGFEDLHERAVKLRDALNGAIDNLCTFDDPKDAADAYDLFDEEVAFDFDVGDEAEELQRAVRATGRKLEEAVPE